MNKIFSFLFKILVFLLILALIPKNFLLDLKNKIDSLKIVQILKIGFNNFLAFIDKNFQQFKLKKIEEYLINFFK
jgi:hypothetical protein